MIPRAWRPLSIVADDLTGACDTSALFTAHGAVPVTVWPTLPPSAPVRGLDTESRALSPAVAAERVRVAAERAGGGLFKKIDSTLRGPVGAEVDAALRGAGLTSAVACPALPAEGRTVVDRVLYVHGVPVADTPITADPQFPRDRGSSVIDLLRPQLDRALAWIPLAQVREGEAALTARLRRLQGMVVLADAETDEDLDALATAALALEPAPLLVGAAGLARALSRCLGLLPGPPVLPTGGRWLIAAGSAHPVTRGQIAAAREAGLRVVATPDAPQTDRLRTAEELAARVREALDAEPVDVLVVTGGETALAVYRALGGERLDVEGAPRPGLAVAWLHAPGRPPLRLLTKAGGFGAPDLLVALHEAAA